MVLYYVRAEGKQVWISSREFQLRTYLPSILSLLAPPVFLFWPKSSLIKKCRVPADTGHPGLPSGWRKGWHFPLVDSAFCPFQREGFACLNTQQSLEDDVGHSLEGKWQSLQYRKPQNQKSWVTVEGTGVYRRQYLDCFVLLPKAPGQVTSRRNHL